MLSWPRWSLRDESLLRTTVRAGLDLGVPFLAAWTVAVPVLRLRRPRLRFRRLFRQPGMAACCAGSAAMVLKLLFLAAIAARLGAGIGKGWLPLPRSMIDPNATAWWIAGAWLCLPAAGGGDPRRAGLTGWGRLLGAGWLAAHAIHYLLWF